jgi:hypothetical protein
MKKRSTKARSNSMQLKQVLGKIKDIIFGVIAAPLLIIIMMLLRYSIKERLRKNATKKGTG